MRDAKGRKENFGRDRLFNILRIFTREKCLCVKRWLRRHFRCRAQVEINCGILDDSLLRAWPPIQDTRPTQLRLDEGDALIFQVKGQALLSEQVIQLRVEY
jgi:hypothetical protein